MMLAIWLFAACRKQPSEHLMMLHSMAENTPDSVLNLLKQIKPEEKKEKVDQALYNLTLIKAKDKTYHSIKSDSTILEVINFYEQTSNDSLLSEAYYYAGRYYAERKDLSQALVYFHKGQECISDTSKQLELQSYLASQIGYVFHKQLLNAEAIKCFKKSLDLCKILNDSCGMVYGMRDLGIAYGFCGKEDSALTYCKKAYQLALKVNEKKLAAGLSAQVARCYNEMGRFAEGEPYILYAIKYCSEERKIAIYANAATTYIGLDQCEKAKGFLRVLEKSPRAEFKSFAYRHLAQIAIKQNDQEMASKYIDNFLENSDSVRLQGEQEATAMAKAAYDYNLIEKENARIEKENISQRYWLVLLLSLLALGGLVGCILVYMNKQKRRFMRFKLQAYKEKLLEEQVKRDRARTSANWRALREDYFPSGSHQNLSEEKWEELKDHIKTTAPDFKEKLSELCKMDDWSYRICILIKMELTPMEIADAMCLSKSAISNHRKRLYKKAFGIDGSPKDWDEIVKGI